MSGALDGLTGDGESQLIYSIYSVGKEQRNWGTVLNQLSAAFRAKASLLERHDFSTRSNYQISTVGVPAQYQELYSHTYSASDPWIPQNRQLATHGRVTTGEQLIDDNNLVRSCFYKDWLQPQGLRYSLLGIVYDEPLMCWSVKLLRDVGTPDFRSGDVALLERLLPHLQQAFSLSRTLNRQDTMNVSVMSALDRMNVGVAFVSPDGQVIATNHLANEIAGAADGICIGPDGLCATNGLEQARLRTLIRRVSRYDLGKAKPRVYMSIQREFGMRPLSIWVEPMTGDGVTCENQRTGATVYIVDPEQHTEPDQDWLISAFELTAAEARIAARLAIGTRLADVAHELGIGYETARTHLKRVFQKTHTDRQADLIRLIATSVFHQRRAFPKNAPSSQFLTAHNDKSATGRMRHRIER